MWRRFCAGVVGCAAVAGLVYGLEPSAGAAPRSERGSAEPRRSASPPFRALDLTGDGGSVELDAGPSDAASAELPMLCFEVHAIDMSRRPIPDVLVLASTLGEPLHHVEARGSASGVATVCAPRDRELALDAWDEDGRWARVTFWNEVEDPLPLVLFEPFEVRGRVIDERGAPIAGAALRVFDGDGGSSSGVAAPAASDADGRFVIPIGRLGIYRLCAEDGVHLPASEWPIAARPAESADVTLVMGDGALLSGTVSERGHPVAGAFVGTDGENTVTDEGGAFSLGPVPLDRRFTVRVEAEGYSPLVTEPLAPGIHALELERTGALEVRARVVGLLRECVPSTPLTETVDEDAIAIAPADVRVWRDGNLLAEQWIDDLRRPIVVADAPPGAVEITVHAFGFDTELDATIRAGATTVLDTSLALPDEWGIVIVRAELSGPPSGDDDGSLRVRAADLDDDHRYDERGVCVPLPAGRQDLAVQRAGLLGEGIVDVVPGRITQARIALTEPPSPRRVIVLDEVVEHARDRTPCVQWLITGTGWLVERAAPGIPVLLPGDRLVAVDGAPVDELDRPPMWGPEGTTVEIAVERPDGSTARATLTRECF